MISHMNKEQTFRLPFKGRWLTFWGGDTKELNRHHDSITEKYAFDFVIMDEKKQTHIGDGIRNEQYYAYGQEVLAPGDGTVVEVVDGVRDNKPGETNLYVLPGNHVLIKHDANIYSFIAHLRQASITVEQGQEIKSGQKIGECGNSGSSGEPHIHFHQQDSFTYSEFKEGEVKHIAKGVKVYFDNVKIRINNGAKVVDRYSPVKNDSVSP